MQALQEELRRGANVAAGDNSQDDNEEEVMGPEEEFDGEVLNHAEERLFRAITKFWKRPTIEVGVFFRKSETR